MKAALLWLLFCVGVLFTLGAPIVIGIWLDNPAMAWAAVLAGAFVTFVSRLDQLSELSVGVVRARMKETIAEANATIEQLRATAVVIARASLGQLIADSFAERITSAQRYRLHDEVIAHLRRLGVSEDQIDEAKEIWNKGVRVIFVRAIGYAVLGKASPSDSTSPTEEQVALGREIGRMRDFGSDWGMPSASTLRALIEERAQMTPLIKKWLDDYQHFEETGEIRDKDQFLTTM